MPLTDQASVKEYIAKYKLEDELSYAVNLAIKENSDDPFKVIADYMKTLQTSPSDDEDDDDDVIGEDQEQAIPAMGSRVRHKQVIAKAVEIPDDWEAPNFEKTAEQMKFLEGIMSTNKLMKNLSPSDRDMLTMALKPGCKFATGAKIITQGDPGDSFYIVEEGNCDISVNGVGSVMKATKGLAFGELALLHNAPRAATVTAECEVTCFSLDMMSFKAILMGKAKKDTEMYIGFLKEVSIFKALSEDTIKTIAGSLKEKKYPEGAQIIFEGDEGDTFYLIREGECKCTKVGSKDEVSKRLTAGDYFGELALIKNDKRAATVTATKSTIVLTVGRKTFDSFIGTLDELKSKSY